MRLIYERASQVFVWLGEASDDSDFAMDLIAHIGASDYTRQSVLDDNDDNPSVIKSGTSALCASLERPWWTRLWVLQEFAVASAVPIIGCGNR